VGSSLEYGQRVLVDLHGDRWAARRPGGMFVSPRFSAFHNAVMPALLEQDALDLLWLVARGEPIAALYNLVDRGRVRFYQSGRRTDLPRGLRPGIAIHALAIRDAIGRGLREYDFLAGESRFKTDLALKGRRMVNLRAVRRSVVEVARRAVDLARGRTAALYRD